MAWQTFGNLAAGNQPASLFDTLSGQIVNCTTIPCSAAGSSTITLTPTTNAGPVTSYQFGQLWTWIQPGNSSGGVTLNGASIGSKLLYTDNTASTQVGTGGTSLLNGARYVAGYDPALNGAQGGFFLIGTPAVLPPATVVQRGYLFGLIMSGGGSQILTVNSGQAASDDFSTLMTLSSTYTKNFTAWTVGSGNGGLDTGSIATNTWYHIYLIQRLDTNVVDVLISASASAPTLPANYTVKRRIGSIKTDATPNIIAFTQHGDEFYFNTPAALDINGTAMPTGSRTLITVQVPLGVVVKWIGAAEVAATASSGAFLLLTDPAAADVAPGDTATPLSSAGMLNGGSSNSRVFGFPRNIWTNTSAQIGARGSNSNAYWVQTYGWLDTRGKLQ